MGGRVRIAAVLPRDDRRRDRGGVSSDSREPGRRGGLGVLPLLQRRGHHRVDGRSRRRHDRHASASTSEVIVINDGSTDGSAEGARPSSSAREPLLRVVTHERNRGYGGALLSGFAAATKQWVFYTDGDGQFDPAELELLVQRASDDVDVVQGYKLRRADGVVRTRDRPGVPPLRHALLRVADPRHRLRLPTDPPRARSTGSTLVHTTGVICVELVRKLQDAGARFTEVGVHHYRRVYGTSEFFRVARSPARCGTWPALWVQLVVLRRGRSRRSRSAA